MIWPTGGQRLSHVSGEEFPFITIGATTIPTPHQEPHAPTSDISGRDLKALENRLDAVLEKKLETMAATLKQSLTPSTSGTLPTPSTPVTSSTAGDLTNTVGTTTPSGPTSPQLVDIPRDPRTEVPVKAKPPTPDQAQEHPAGDQPSRNSLRSPLTRDTKSSRRSRSKRRSTHRRRETSHKSHRHERDRGTTQTRTAHDRHHLRTERYTITPRTSRTEPNDGRNRDHPIFRRANTFRQVHQDAHSTVYSKDSQDKTKFPYS